MAKKGKGIESLIPKKSKKGTAGGEDTAQGVFLVELAKIVINPRQPRKTFPETGLSELAASIREHGILQPLVVEKEEEETEGGVAVRYHLLAGERRLHAAKKAGLSQVPVVVRRAGDDRTRLLLSLIENVQREDLNALERAEAFQRLRDEFQLTYEEIGQRIGKSREAVANTVRLLQLGEVAQEAVRAGELSEGHARTILSVPEEHQEQFFERLKQESMNVREAESEARSLAQRERTPKRTRKDTAAVKEAERLKETFGVPVRITTRGKRGSVSFVFRSKEELEELLKRFLERS